MTGRPVLSGLNLIVRNMEASIAFYQRLGVDIPEGAVWRTASGAHHVDVRMPNGFGLDLDSEDLAEGYNTGWRPAAPRCLIGFSLASRDAVDQTYRDLVNAGYTGLQVPYDAFWGARYAIVEDPDGNQVGLMSPQDDSRRQPPPSI